MHEEARPLLAHCEHGLSRLHLSFALRQWVQLSWIRFRLAGGWIEASEAADLVLLASSIVIIGASSYYGRGYSTRREAR